MGSVTELASGIQSMSLFLSLFKGILPALWLVMMLPIPIMSRIGLASWPIIRIRKPFRTLGRIWRNAIAGSSSPGIR